jgi:hypothetical protein
MSESIKQAAQRAKELRELADMVEAGKIKALVWGIIGLTPVVGVLGGSMALEEGSSEDTETLGRLIVTLARKQPMMADDKERLALGNVVGTDDQGDYDALDAYRRYSAELELAVTTAEVMGQDPLDYIRGLADAGLVDLRHLERPKAVDFFKWHHCPICRRDTKHVDMPPFDDGAPCARCAVCGSPHEVTP